MEANMPIEYSNEIDYDILLSKKGDGKAFGRLIHTYKVTLHRVAKSILKNEHDTEDAVSETILKAYKNIKLLKSNENFKSWILKILVNQCNDIIRKKKREVTLENRQDQELAYEDRYEDFELLRAINTLEENQRTVTLLFYFDDISVKDIAKILSIPEGTVKSRLSRAKNNLEYLVKD